MGLTITTLSAASRPASTQRLSVCLMMKNEAEHLDRCLASVAGVADEIVIVDTGSTDDSVAIAERHGARVLFEDWTGDFAHHRNTSIDAATGDWILILDADEELVGGEALRPLLDDPDVEGYSLREINFVGEEADMDAVVNAAFRLFRNRPEYRYEGALHEQVHPKVVARGETRFVGVEINHYGYLDGTVDGKKKKDRNMRIVLEEVRRKPDDAFTRFNAGVEFQRVGDHTTALQHFTHGFTHLGSMAQYFASLLVRSIVTSLMALERWDEALDVVTQALDAYADFPDMHYLQGQIHAERREYREAIASFQRAIDLGDHAGDRYMAQVGMGSFHCWWALGALHEQIGDRSEAVRCYRRAITGAPSLNIRPLVRLTGLLLKSDPVERVVPFMRGLLPERRRHEALRHLAGVLIDEGHLDAAEALLDEALAIDPGHHPARIAKAHTALAMGQVDRALEILDAVPATSDSHRAACGQRALAGVAAGRPDVVEDAIARLGEEESDINTVTWRLAMRARAGDAVSRPVGTDADALAATLLGMASMLLHLGFLEAFNALVPALYAVAPSAAELDEGLGHILLTNGFDEPAADRLMRAVDAGVASAQTHAALGRICADRGLVEEAETFCRVALDGDRENLARYLDLVGILSGSGRYAEASEVLDAGLRVWPRSTVLREVRQALGMLADVTATPV